MDFDKSDTLGMAGELAHLALAGDWEGAVERGLRHLGHQAGPNLYLHLATLLGKAQMIDAAEACLQQGCARWPDNILLSQQSAELATRHRSFNAAAARWEDLMARHPESPVGLCGLANLHRITKSEGEAARLFAEANVRYPAYVWAAHGHANTATWRHDWPEAAQRWAAVRDRFPNHDLAHANLARALMEQDRLAEAEEVARLGLVAFPQAESLNGISARIAERLREGTVEFFIDSAFRHLLQRDPIPEEIAHWLKLIREGLPERDFFRQMISSHEYKRQHPVTPGHPPGHFYSPVVNPAEAAAYWQKSAAASVADLAGIDLDLEEMDRFWQQNKDFMREISFDEKAGGITRYYYDNGLFPHGDAVVLAGMIHQYRPKRVVEIGSGFSSGAMLDAADRLDLGEFHLTCIDLNCQRLRSFLRPQDHSRVTIMEGRVQDIPVATFSDLQAGDILFINSSHVMKTGSDVHYELFYILPALRPGVIIHFHDIHFPFEYPERWVLEFRWAWNEIYALRAFLSYNNEFRVVFFTDLFLRQRPELLPEIVPGKRLLFGASIWITKLANSGHS